jgi:hypothetical protein
MRISIALTAPYMTHLKGCNFTVITDLPKFNIYVTKSSYTFNYL